MEQSRDVMVVVVNLEALVDQIANHRPGPDPTGIPGALRTCIEPCPQFIALRLGQLQRRPRRFTRHQAVHAHRLIPLQPSIDRAPGHSGLPRQLDHAPSLDIPEHGSPSPPLAQVSSLLCLSNEPPQVPSP